MRSTRSGERREASSNEIQQEFVLRSPNVACKGDSGNNSGSGGCNGCGACDAATDVQGLPCSSAEVRQDPFFDLSGRGDSSTVESLPSDIQALLTGILRARSSVMNHNVSNGIDHESDVPSNATQFASLIPGFMGQAPLLSLNSTQPGEDGIANADDPIDNLRKRIRVTYPGLSKAELERLLELLRRFLKDLRYDPGGFPPPPPPTVKDILDFLSRVSMDPSKTAPPIVIRRKDLGDGPDDPYAQTTREGDTIVIEFNNNPRRDAFSFGDVFLLIVCWHELRHAWMFENGVNDTDERSTAKDINEQIARHGLTAAAVARRMAAAYRHHGGIYFTDAKTACTIACDPKVTGSDHDAACEMFQNSKVEAEKDFRNEAKQQRELARIRRAEGNTKEAEAAENTADAADGRADEAAAMTCPCC